MKVGAGLLAAVLAWSLGASGNDGAQRGSFFRSGIDLVRMGVTVMDRRGALVTDLSVDDFEILEDGVRQTVSYFGSGDPGAGGPELHVGILLDVSRSMADDLEFMRTASIRFLNRLSDAVDITLVDFAGDIRTARFSQSNFRRVVERIRGQRVRSFTAFYDALGVYLDGAADQSGRKVVLAYTDGSDTRSSLGFTELIDLLKASDVTIYAIGAFQAGAALRQRANLQQIAGVTGGQVFFPGSVRELDAIYDRIVAEVRAQYTLGYVSTNTATDGAWRDVTVRVTRGDRRSFRVRARRGYYAPFLATPP